MTGREIVLGRVRAALRDAPPAADVPRDYRARSAYDAGSWVLLDLLADRLADYRAHVQRVPASGQVAAAVADALVRRRARRVVVPSGLPADWVPGGTVDPGTLSAADLDGFDAVVTACAVAVAETGTIVLDGSPDQGRRAITLVPDVHVCVVRADQVVHLVPEALARLDPTRPLTFVSGPSATSDIELNRVEGVHGPRTLEVLLVG